MSKYNGEISRLERPSEPSDQDPSLQPSAVFFDLGRTLLATKRGGIQRGPNGEVTLLPGLREAVDRLPGVSLFIVTNQKGVDRWRVTAAEVERWLLFVVHHHLGERLTAVRYCPHGPESDCPGRKPGAGMVLALAAAYDVDLTRAWFVGNSWKDQECARRAGVGRFYGAQTFFAFWILDWPDGDPHPRRTRRDTKGHGPEERRPFSDLLRVPSCPSWISPKSKIQNAEVRPSTAADLPAIVRIYNDAIEERISTCDLEPVSVAARRPWFERFGARHPLHVAVVEESVVGWSALLPYDPKPGYAGVVEHSIYVARKARGAGLGRRLLEHLLRTATELDHRCMLGRIFRHNEPSLALHRRLGFEEVGVLPGTALLDGREADVLFMLRRL